MYRRHCNDDDDDDFATHLLSSKVVIAVIYQTGWEVVLLMSQSKSILLDPEQASM